MQLQIKRAAAVLALALTLAAPARAGITIYEHDDFQGEAVTLDDAAPDFRDFGFNDRASSLLVRRESWELCKDIRFGGGCIVLKPGRYRSLSEMRLNDRLSSARPVDDGRLRPGRGGGEIVFYPDVHFRGQGLATTRDEPRFDQAGFNDRASSVIVFEGRWEACEHINYGGRCVLLQPGRYPDLASMGLNDRLSSARLLRVGTDRDPPRPPPAPVYDWRQRHGERVWPVALDGLRAVFAVGDQRCWIEQPLPLRGPDGAPPAPLSGGILGHAVAGPHGPGGLRRCAEPPTQPDPLYWEASYPHRGGTHWVQLSAAPSGPTLLVNQNGEPRY